MIIIIYTLGGFLRTTFFVCVGYFCMHFKLSFCLKFTPTLFSSFALASIYALMFS